MVGKNNTASDRRRKRNEMRKKLKSGQSIQIKIDDHPELKDVVDQMAKISINRIVFTSDRDINILYHVYSGCIEAPVGEDRLFGDNPTIIQKMYDAILETAHLFIMSPKCTIELDNYCKSIFKNYPEKTLPLMAMEFFERLNEQSYN